MTKRAQREPGFTVAASTVRGLLFYSGARGLSLDGVLALAGLREEDLQGPEARLSQAANNLIFAEVAARSGDADLGLHFAERLDLDSLDIIGHLAAHSTTLGEALRRVCAHSRLLHDSGRVDLERRGGEAILYPGCRGLLHEYPRHVAEFATLAALVLARRVTGAKIVPRAVMFKHDAPAHTAEHLRLFGVMPRFGQAETMMVFDEGVLALKIVGAQPGLASYLDAYAKEVLSRLPESRGMVGQVERVVTTTLPRGVPEIEDVAAQLAMSPRTLQRRLGEEGETFAAIVDRVRQRTAERYLEDDKLSLAEIGFLIGFADPSNFHRAFKRWSGETPSGYRARMGGRGGEPGVSPRP